MILTSRLLHLLVIATATLATLCALYGWDDLFRLTKPLPMALAVILLLAGSAGNRPARLLLAVALAGDVLLMVPNGFMAGLIAFLGTHLCYLPLFRRGVGWLPSRLAAAAVLGLPGLVLAWEFPLLPGALRLPVGVYTTVIALMVAQAIGRAAKLGTRVAWLTASGATLFVASDTMISLNRFVAPLPLADFAIMASYFLGQILILRHALEDETA
jgi:uncharacterized membrane protein YhhN